MRGPLKPEEITNAYLVFYASSALQCSIHQNIREVQVDYVKKDNVINFFVFFDGIPSDDQTDDVGAITTEMSCQFTSDIEFIDHIIVVPYPQKIPSKGICVFRRYEPFIDSKSSVFKQFKKEHRELVNSMPNIENILDIVFYTNRALQCEIRPNMRKISVEYIKNEKKFVLYLYYDKPQTQEELNYDVAGTIIAEISSNFPNSLDIKWEDEVVVLPYPARMPDKGICVFRRYEPSPPEEQHG